MELSISELSIRRWGRVKMNMDVNTLPDALLGTCLGMPTSWRLDARFIHGFEDFDLSIRFKQAGGSLLILPHVHCMHHEGGTLDSHSPIGLQYSVRGHLELFDSLVKSPIILMTYYYMILSKESSIKDRIQMTKRFIKGLSIGFVMPWQRVLLLQDLVLKCQVQNDFSLSLM